MLLENSSRVEAVLLSHEVSELWIWFVVHFADPFPFVTPVPFTCYRVCSTDAGSWLLRLSELVAVIRDMFSTFWMAVSRWSFAFTMFFAWRAVSGLLAGLPACLPNASYIILYILHHNRYRYVYRTFLVSREVVCNCLASLVQFPLHVEFNDIYNLSFPCSHSSSFAWGGAMWSTLRPADPHHVLSRESLRIGKSAIASYESCRPQFARDPSWPFLHHQLPSTQNLLEFWWSCQELWNRWFSTASLQPCSACQFSCCFGKITEAITIRWRWVWLAGKEAPCGRSTRQVSQPWSLKIPQSDCQLRQSHVTFVFSPTPSIPEIEPWKMCQCFKIWLGNSDWLHSTSCCCIHWRFGDYRIAMATWSGAEDKFCGDVPWFCGLGAPKLSGGWHWIGDLGSFRNGFWYFVQWKLITGPMPNQGCQKRLRARKDTVT